MKIKEFLKEEYKFIIFIIVLAVLFYVKLPYYIMAPGGTINITNRIEMEGYKNEEGSLNMLYVSEYEATPITYLWAKIKGYDTYASKEKIVAEESVKEANERDKIMRDNSLDIATLVAYTKASKKIDIKSQQNIVILSTSDNGLKIGDIIEKVDGIYCSDVEEIRKIIRAKEVGDTVTFQIKRDGKDKEVTSEIYMEDNAKVVGVVMITEYDYSLDPQIDIKFKNSESGSSGGLMLTLTIYNAISGEDIIKGRNIAGTGTISSDGTVGEIDGIKYKIMGAARNNIEIVFVPSANYDEAVKTKEKYHYNMTLVKVDTVDEAISYLRK